MVTPRMFNLLEDYPASATVDYMSPPISTTKIHPALPPGTSSTIPLTQHPAFSVPTPSPVEHPPHYKNHPSGLECIQVTEHMNFNIGNAVKYAWRCDYKGNPIEDLKKARWYIDREISRREARLYGTPHLKPK